MAPTDTRRVVGRGNKKSSPPIFSHEFVIQNHGDITSVILMIVFVAFMFPMTSPIASIFMIPQYNETIEVPVQGAVISTQAWQVGVRDVFTVLFYTVAAVTMHAIFQEYLIDKIFRKALRDNKLSLSKTKQVKLTESGHMTIFHVYTLVHAGWIISDTFLAFSDLQKLWVGYPESHKYMDLRTKFFFIVQMAWWLQEFPQFYLQKLKGEEMRARTLPILIHIAVIAAAYAMNFTRLALFVLAIESLMGALFHAGRIFHFIERKTLSSTFFRAYNIVFLGARLVETLLAVMVFWHGLKHTEVPFVDIAAGNYNTSFIRLNCLLVMTVLQGYLVVSFPSFHFNRFRDNWAKKSKKPQSSAVQPAKSKKKSNEDEKKTN